LKRRPPAPTPAFALPTGSPDYLSSSHPFFVFFNICYEDLPDRPWQNSHLLPNYHWPSLLSEVLLSFPLRNGVGSNPGTLYFIANLCSQLLFCPPPRRFESGARHSFEDRKFDLGYCIYSLSQEAHMPYLLHSKHLGFFFFPFFFLRASDVLVYKPEPPVSTPFLFIFLLFSCVIQARPPTNRGSDISSSVFFLISLLRETRCVFFGMRQECTFTP